MSERISLSKICLRKAFKGSAKSLLGRSDLHVRITWLPAITAGLKLHDSFHHHKDPLAYLGISPNSNFRELINDPGRRWQINLVRGPSGRMLPHLFYPLPGRADLMPVRKVNAETVDGTAYYTRKGLRCLPAWIQGNWPQLSTEASTTLSIHFDHFNLKSCLSQHLFIVPANNRLSQMAHLAFDLCLLTCLIFQTQIRVINCYRRRFICLSSHCPDRL